MKISKRVVMASFLVVPCLFATGISAHLVSAQAEPVEESTLVQRLEKRKAELNIRQLPNAEKLRLQQKCKASQGSLSALKGRITGINTSRANVYQALNNRLAKLVERLKSAGADTAGLETEITELSTKIETFSTDLEAYKLAVSDLASMECAADPVAFKASLEAARAARTKVASDANDIKKFVNDTIKPTIKELRAQLEKPNGGTE